MTTDRSLRGIRFAVVLLVGCIVALTFGVMWATLVQAPRTDRLARKAEANTAALRVVTARLQDITSEAAQFKRDTTTRCEAGNDYRRQDKQLWNYLINVSPPPGTQSEADRLAAFKQFINQHDALVSCDPHP